MFSVLHSATVQVEYSVDDEEERIVGMLGTVVWPLATAVKEGKKMALEHEFYLIPNTIDVERLWMNRVNNPKIIDSVVIHDDIIQYVSDTLKWIPSRNPELHGTPISTGINYYGVTLFDKDSAIILKSIFSSWRDLFLNSPAVLELTGEFVMVQDGEQSGYYEKLAYNRNEIIHQFEKIISFSDRLSEGKFYLYHCGI